MHTESGSFSIPNLFDDTSKWKQWAQFYLISAALITFILPPEYNNPFLVLIGLNSILNKNLLKNAIGALKNPLVYIPLIFWALHLISMSYSEDKVQAGKEIEKLAALGFFPFFIALGPKLNKVQVQNLKWHFILAVSLYSLYSIFFSFYNMMGENGFEFSWVQLSYENLVSGVGVQPLYFSMFIALALFMLFDIQRRGQSSPFKIVLIVYLFIYMIMLSTRMTTLAFFAIFGAHSLVLAIRTKKFLYHSLSLGIFIFTAAMIILFNPVNKKRFEEALNPNSNYQTDQYGGRSIRLEKWKCSLSVFAQSPLIGVGAGDLKGSLMQCYEEKNIDAALFHQFNSHNQYLNTLGQLGLPGIGVLLLLLVYVFRKAWLNNDDVLIIFLGLFALCILSETMLARRWGIFYFTLFYSVFLFYETDSHSGSTIAWLKTYLSKKK